MPGEAVVGVAGAAARLPLAGQRPAAVAHPGRVGEGLAGLEQPFAGLVQVAVLGLLQARHEAADPVGRAGLGRPAQVAPGLAPELGIERRLGQRQEALQVLGREGR